MQQRVTGKDQRAIILDLATIADENMVENVSIGEHFSTSYAVICYQMGILVVEQTHETSKCAGKDPTSLLRTTN